MVVSDIRVAVFFPGKTDVVPNIDIVPQQAVWSRLFRGCLLA